MVSLCVIKQLSDPVWDAFRRAVLAAIGGTIAKGIGGRWRRLLSSMASSASVPDRSRFRNDSGEFGLQYGTASCGRPVSYRKECRAVCVNWNRICVLALGGLVGACVDVAPPELNVPVDFTLFGGGNSFVVRGTGGVVDNNGPCPVWFGENGVTYHLSQNPRLENEIFDRVSAPGITSRLVLVVREDLEFECAFGRTVEVVDVLEVVE